MTFNIPRLRKRNAVSSALAATFVLGSLMLAASPAEANAGYCGYYSQSRAVNSTCSDRQVRSVVRLTSGEYKYGGWAFQGFTSWQAASWVNVSYYYYGVRFFL